jgi:hypothetical protein
MFLLGERIHETRKSLLGRACIEAHVDQQVAGRRRTKDSCEQTGKPHQFELHLSIFEMALQTT